MHSCLGTLLIGNMNRGESKQKEKKFENTVGIRAAFQNKISEVQSITLLQSYGNPKVHYLNALLEVSDFKCTYKYLKKNLAVDKISGLHSANHTVIDNDLTNDLIMLCVAMFSRHNVKHVKKSTSYYARAD